MCGSERAKVLIVGGGIGGLTAAIALAAKGFAVEVIERDPTWSVYGVGIIQQGNVIRAMADLGLIEDYVHAGFGFDHVEVAIPTGQIVATIPIPPLVRGLPPSVAIARRALQKVLADRVRGAGATVRLGVTVEETDDDGAGVSVRFSDGTNGRYDLLVGADGLHSHTRTTLFPNTAAPAFTGQAVWRYNFPRAPEITGLRAFEGPTGVGLVPLSDDVMYMRGRSAACRRRQHELRSRIPRRLVRREAGRTDRVTAVPRDYVRSETILSIAIIAVLSLFFFLPIFALHGPVAVSKPDIYAFDFLTQSIAIAFMATLAPGVITSARLRARYGWIAAKPACSAAPFAVTPDEMGDRWHDVRVCTTRHIDLIGKRFGAIGRAAGMQYGFHELIADAARTRSVVADTIVGSSNVSTPDRDRYGSSCMQERRPVDAIPGCAPMLFRALAIASAWPATDSPFSSSTSALSTRSDRRSNRGATISTT